MLPYKKLNLSIIKNFNSIFFSKLNLEIKEALFTRVFIIGLALISTGISSRLLGPHGRGIWVISVNLSLLGGQLGLIGQISANTFYGSKFPEKKPLLISNCIYITGISSGVTILLIVTFKNYLINNNVLHGSIFLVSCLQIPLILYMQAFRGFLTCLEEFRIFNISTILEKVCPLILLMLYLYNSCLSPLKLVVFQLISLCIVITYITKHLRIHIYPLFSRPHFSLMKNTVSYGVKSYISNLCEWGMIRIDIFILQQTMNISTIGLFSIALTVIDIFILTASTISRIIYPKLCKELEYNKKWLIVLFSFFIVIIAICFGSIALLNSKKLFLYVFGEHFEPSYYLCLQLIPSALLASLCSLLTAFITSSSYPPTMTCIWLIGLMVKSLLTFYFTQKFGIEGIQLSWIYSYTLLSSMLLCFAIYLTVKNHPVNNYS